MKTDPRAMVNQIDNTPAPDLWRDIEGRRPGPPPPEPSHRSRLAAGLVAAVVSIAAFALLVSVFRTEPDSRTPSGAPLSPLTIRVWTTTDPSDLHISATYRGEPIDLVGIETPGPDLEYPNSASAELPVGTPIVLEPTEGISVSVFELDPAQGKFVVEDGSCLIPGSLRALPGPDETAFFIYAEGKGWSGGQAFRAETIGEALDHHSAIDPSSTVDASKLGLAFCGTDGTVASGKETFAGGSDPLAGSWQLFTQRETEFGPVLGVRIPGHQTFTVELHPLSDRTFGPWSMTGVGGDILLLAQIVAPAVVRAEIMLDNGTVVGGELVALKEIIGPAKVFVAGFSSRMSGEGQQLDPNGFVVVYGANGEEIARRRLAQG